MWPLNVASRSNGDPQRSFVLDSILFNSVFNGCSIVKDAASFCHLVPAPGAVTGVIGCVCH